jgi:hypothetical protein
MDFSMVVLPLAPPSFRLHQLESVGGEAAWFAENWRSWRGLNMVYPAMSDCFTSKDGRTREIWKLG